MPEELHLVTELAIILIAAGTFTIISKALKQPLILGYIIAGFLVGPHLGLFPQFSTDAIHEWSELGIIFLLFGLGLEFSFKKLVKIGSSAFITAGVQCMGMFAVGFVTGKVMGWSAMESIFLGGLMGMSSTTIIIKAYDDLGLKSKPYASLIFGSLVFEDLIAVLLMVLLSTIAVTGQFSGSEMLMALLKLVFFLILWFLVGIYLIPIILRKARRFLSDEIMLLVSIGLCFSMVVLANIAGFSSALGAFVMGSLLAETIEGERIAKLTSSIKDLFGAIFFVSVGMMVDPAVIAQHWPLILILTIITICGILTFSTTGALLAGKGLDISVHAGFSLAQLGEFSFIIAGLGCSLGVMRDFIYPVIIAVSVITTFTTPYMIKLGDPASRWLRKSLPASIIDRIDPPQDAAASGTEAEKSEWSRLLTSYILRLVLYGVIIIAILLGFGKLLPKFCSWALPEAETWLTNLICTVVTLIVLSPFLYGIVNSGSTVKECGRHLLKKNPSNRWALLAIILLRVAVGVMTVVAVLELYYDLQRWLLPIVIIAFLVFIQISRRSIKSFSTLESTFLGNLNEKEEQIRRAAPVTTRINDALSKYDIHIQSIVISQDFDFIGKTLREMPFRKAAGVNIVKITRGSKNITIPSGNELIYPGDKLLAVGTTEQLQRFASIIKENESVAEAAGSEEFTVDAITLDSESSLVGKTLRTLAMRASGCMVVSVLHDGVLHTNPDPDFKFEPGDTVWIAGEKSAVDWYK